MSDPNTVRILSLDGGGMRGYMSLVFLQRFIQQWGISQADLWKNFDVITGTSIGGIAALAYANGVTPDEFEPFFTDVGQWIFTIRTAGDVISGSHNASLPSNRPNFAQKVGLVLTGDQFYTSAYPDSNYGSVRLAQELQTVFTTDTLQNLKTNVLIPSYQYDTKTYVLYSNLNYAEFIGQNELISNVALATSSAPLYLPSVSFGGHEYIDGGVYQNNPANLGLTLAKMLKPLTDRACVLSIGTGLGELGFDQATLLRGAMQVLREGATNHLRQYLQQNLPFIDQSQIDALITANSTEEQINLLVSLFDIASTGGQESVAKNLELEATYTLDNLYQYRFQPVLDQNQDTELDNSDPEFITYMHDTAIEYFNNDIDNINTFIGHLTA